ncbi:MAG: Ig-like domain-containing protein [Ruminococcus sp.]
MQDYIAQSLRNLDLSIDIEEYNVKKEDIIQIFRATCFDNPDIFYVNDTYILFYHKDGYVTQIMPQYTFVYADVPKYIDKFNKAAQSILSEMDSSWGEYKKALFLHDKLAESCKYVDGNARYHSAYNALVTNRCVCEGYSKAYSYLLSLVGIDSKCINSKSMEHCWNIIKISGNWYHVDVTKDDPLPDTCGLVRHRYFLCSDSFLKNDKTADKHRNWDSDITYSSEFKCTDKTYDKDFTKSINSQIYIYGKSYYYIDNNYKGKHISALIKRTGNSKKVLKIIKDVWKTSKGAYIYDSFSKLSYNKGYLYFNSSRKIYRLNLKNDKLSTVYKLPIFIKNDFYGLEFSGNYIRATMKKSDTAKGKVADIIRIKNNKLLKLPLIKHKSLTIKKGKTAVLKVYMGSGKVKYKTSNKKVASVNSKGKIKALKKGVCTITAVKNGINMNCKVKVTK